MIPDALKIVRAHFEKEQKHFIISMAPEFPYLRTQGKYVPYITALEQEYDFIAPQLYNQGVTVSVLELNGSLKIMTAKNLNSYMEFQKLSTKEAVGLSKSQRIA